jgi:hypothetical protein
LMWHFEARSWATDMAESGGDLRQRGDMGGEKKGLTCGPEKREKATSLEGANQKGKHIPLVHHRHMGQTGRLGEATG